MAYVAESTRTTGTLITATIWNQAVKDNTIHLAGMLRLGTALSALSAGSKLQVVEGCYLRKSANQTISHNAAAADLTWDTEVFDLTAYHSGSSAEIVVPVGTASGYGLIVGIISLTLASAQSGYTAISILQNGATIRGINAPFGFHTSGSNAAGGIAIIEPIAIAASDTFKIQVAQVNNGSVSATLTGGSLGSTFGLLRIE